MNRLLYLLGILLFSGTTACKKDMASDVSSYPQTYFPATRNAAGGISKSTSPEFKLISFTVQKLKNTKANSTNVCESYNVRVTWTAINESKVLGYDLEKSSMIDFPFVTVLAHFPSSEADASISRSYLDGGSTGGRSLTYYYRLKIYYADGTTGFSQTQSVNVHTSRCAWQ